MHGQIQSPPDIQLTLESRLCAVDSCQDTAAVELDSRPMCLNHFLPVCTQELESRCNRLKNSPYDPGAADSFKLFLVACTQQASHLLGDQRTTDEDVKTRLQAFLSHASHLGHHLRRSPRVASSVPVWLRREDPGRTWEEETWTVTLSRHGAGLVCRHPVEKGGTVVLCRRDKGSRAEARVVYARFDSEGRRHIGVELLDHENFWDQPHASRPSEVASRVNRG